jgi:hypothetical protein
MEGLGVTALAVRLDFRPELHSTSTDTDREARAIPFLLHGRVASNYLERTYQTIAAMTISTSRPLPKDKCGP